MTNLNLINIQINLICFNYTYVNYNYNYGIRQILLHLLYIIIKYFVLKFIQKNYLDKIPELNPNVINLI
jgi:hypothetical protein